MGEVSYMINVKTGETLDQPFGDFVQKKQFSEYPMPSLMDDFLSPSNVFLMPKTTVISKAPQLFFLLIIRWNIAPPPRTSQ